MIRRNHGKKCHAERRRVCDARHLCISRTNAWIPRFARNDTSGNSRGLGYSKGENALMAGLKQCEFFLLRYVPDAVKDEFVNIGVLLVEPRRRGKGFVVVK